MWPRKHLKDSTFINTLTLEIHVALRLSKRGGMLNCRIWKMEAENLCCCPKTKLYFNYKQNETSKNGHEFFEKIAHQCSRRAKSYQMVNISAKNLHSLIICILSFLFAINRIMSPTSLINVLDGKFLERITVHILGKVKPSTKQNKLTERKRLARVNIMAIRKKKISERFDGDSVGSKNRIITLETYFARTSASAIELSRYRNRCTREAAQNPEPYRKRLLIIRNLEWFYAIRW